MRALLAEEIDFVGGATGSGIPYGQSGSGSPGAGRAVYQAFLAWKQSHPGGTWIEYEDTHNTGNPRP